MPIFSPDGPPLQGDQGLTRSCVPLSDAVCERKVELSLDGFPSQRDRRWLTPDTVWALLRLRGVESNAPSGLAEAFYRRKATMGLADGTEPQ
jgi:hypothetical protein